MKSYQITFEDVVHLQSALSAPGRCAFLDESGGFGFDFEKDGVTRYYIVCAVIVNNDKVLVIENKLDEIKRALFGGTEMKSSTIGSDHKRRAKVLVELVQLDFQILFMIADKKNFIEESPLKVHKESFIKFLHQKLYNSMYSSYPKLKIIEDEFGTSEFQQGYKSYVINNRPENNLFSEYDFDYVNSKNNNIVQVADILAGSVMQHLNNSEAPDVLKIFKGKIVDIINFPEPFQLYKSLRGVDNKYDNAIYELSLKCANDYVEKNKNSRNYEERLRVHFLRYLLFNAKMYQESRYIYADEILEEFYKTFSEKVTKNYLYRRIVAPLRDDGVIIASSSHGYKIPKSSKDISTYVNQSITVIGPMLSRIGKCREKILMYTEKELDILKENSLTGYRRFFGDFE